MDAGQPASYLDWLAAKIGHVRTRRSMNTYHDLLRKLSQTEFVWFVANDDNRAEDGRQLRLEWVTTQETPADPAWLASGCSFLEMLIALSYRLEFQSSSGADAWFWHLLMNIDLTAQNDRVFDEQEVEDRTHAVMFRTYERNGHGGLFPLRRSRKDQRKVEIWQQMSAYLLQDA